LAGVRVTLNHNLAFRSVANSSIRSLGLRLLGLWLLLHAFIDLFSLSFQYQSLVLTVLALVTGVLLIVGS
jgi:hypothetical protein